MRLFALFSVLSTGFVLSAVAEPVNVVCTRGKTVIRLLENANSVCLAEVQSAGVLGRCNRVEENGSPQQKQCTLKKEYIDPTIQSSTAHKIEYAFGKVVLREGAFPGTVVATEPADMKFVYKLSLDHRSATLNGKWLRCRRADP